MKQTFTREEVIELLEYIGKEEVRGFLEYLPAWEEKKHQPEWIINHISDSYDARSDRYQSIIKAAIRMSDGIEFKIGDKFDDSADNNNNYHITSFKVDGKTLCVFDSENDFFCNIKYAVNLSNSKK